MDTYDEKAWELCLKVTTWDHNDPTPCPHCRTIAQALRDKDAGVCPDQAMRIIDQELEHWQNYQGAIVFAGRIKQALSAAPGPCIHADNLKIQEEATKMAGERVAALEAQLAEARGEVERLRADQQSERKPELCLGCGKEINPDYGKCLLCH